MTAFFPVFLFLTSVIGLIYASYTDLKERIISNKITYGMVAIGLTGHGIYSFFVNDYSFLTNSIIATLFTFTWAFLLYKVGFWAGGDVKLFTGIAALNPFNNNIAGIFGTISLPIFTVSLLFFSIFAMFPYSVLLILNELRKQKKLKQKVLQNFKNRIKKMGIFLAILIAGEIFYPIGTLFLLGIAFAMFLNYLIKKNYSKSVKYFFYAFFLWSIYERLFVLSFEIFTGLISALFLFAFFQLYVVGKPALNYSKKITQLEEGEIPAQTIIIKGKKAIVKKSVGIKTIIKHLKENRLKELQSLKNEKIVVSEKKARGVTEEEIKILKRLVKEKKLKNTIMLKKSAPLAPAILIGYVMLNLVGDVLWQFLI